MKRTWQDYGVTTPFWAAYPIPLDAQSAVLQISGAATMNPDVTTAFVIGDLGQLECALNAAELNLRSSRP